jgi:hypothetical protein
MLENEAVELLRMLAPALPNAAKELGPVAWAVAFVQIAPCAMYFTFLAVVLCRCARFVEILLKGYPPVVPDESVLRNIMENFQRKK